MIILLLDNLFDIGGIMDTISTSKIFLITFMIILLFVNLSMAQERIADSYKTTTLEPFCGKWNFEFLDEEVISIEFFNRKEKLIMVKQNEQEYPRELMTFLNKNQYHESLRKLIPEGVYGKYFIEKDPIYGDIFYEFYDFKDSIFHKCKVIFEDKTYLGVRIK